MIWTRPRGSGGHPAIPPSSGIDGTARPISFKMSARDTEANRLNRAEVTTVVRRNGWRVWGNRSTADDPLWAFLSVTRTDYVIRDAIEAAHGWAMDRPFSAQLLNDLRDGVQAFGNSLVQRGAFLGFNCWRGLKLFDVMQMDTNAMFNLLPRITQPILDVHLTNGAICSADLLKLSTTAVGFLGGEIEGQT